MKISWERVNNSMKIRLAESDLTFSKAALQRKPVRCCSEVEPNNFWKKPKGKVNLFDLLEMKEHFTESVIKKSKNGNKAKRENFESQFAPQ